MKQMREVFEKTLADSKVKTFKMKFMFKRWLEYEERFGDVAGVEIVKERAGKFVEKME